MPEDISLVGFGGTWRNSPILQRLTSVAIDEIATGHQAVELLEQMRNGKRPLDDNEEIVLPLSPTAGESLGAVPETEEKQAEK